MTIPEEEEEAPTETVSATETATIATNETAVVIVTADPVLEATHVPDHEAGIARPVHGRGPTPNRVPDRALDLRADHVPRGLAHALDRIPGHHDLARHHDPDDPAAAVRGAAVVTAAGETGNENPVTAADLVPENIPGLESRGDGGLDAEIRAIRGGPVAAVHAAHDEVVQSPNQSRGQSRDRSRGTDPSVLTLHRLERARGATSQSHPNPPNHPNRDLNHRTECTLSGRPLG